MCANPSGTNVPRHTTNFNPKCSCHTSLFWTLSEQLGTDDTTHVCQPWTNVPRHTTNFNPKIFISHIPVLNFAGTTRNRLHHACVPTHPEDTPQNVRPQDFHLTHPSFELCRSSSPYYTTHVSQPILNQRPKTHYKLQIRKNSSHISLFWTLPEQLGTDDTTHVCQPILNQRSKDRPQNLRPQDFHLTHTSFELCRSSSPYYTTHVSQPILNQRPKTHYKLQIRTFSSHTSLFLNFAGTTRNRWHHACVPTHPEPTFQRHATKPQTLRFSSHTSLFWTLPEQLSILHHTCEPTHPEPTSQNRLQTSDPIFFHLTHPCFELCRNSLPCYTTHVSQPILHQRPKIQHKRLMTQFCKPILIQPPKIHLSKFQCSPYRRQKCRALQEDTVEWKPVCNLQAKNGSQ